MNNTNYYSVVVKGGHVGRNFYITKKLAIMATSKKEAAYKARFSPRVKHDQLDAIDSVTQISSDEFEKLRNEANNDPYFTSTSIQQYRMYCTNYKDFIIQEERDDMTHDSFERKQKICFKIRKRMLMEER